MSADAPPAVFCFVNASDLTRLRGRSRMAKFSAGMMALADVIAKPAEPILKLIAYGPSPNSLTCFSQMEEDFTAKIEAEFDKMIDSVVARPDTQWGQAASTSRLPSSNKPPGSA